ncbi:MAG TPA: type II secretion system protein GspL [Limnobacter sp.]|nr:type II secretion system protein GspL [Limnobacter sp.]
MNKNQAMLVLWWPKAPEQARAEEEGRQPRVRFEVVAPNGDRLHGGEELLNRLPTDLPCLVLLDPSEVGLFAVNPPKLSGNKLKEALPFLVEPFLLNEPEENHVSLWSSLPRHAQGAQLATVLGKLRARSVVGQCKQLGLKIAGVSCETLRDAHNHGVLWTSGEYALLTDGVDTPAAVSIHQPVVAKVVLEKRLAAAPASSVICSPATLQQLQGLGLAQHPALQVGDTKALTPLRSLLQKSLLGADELRRLGMRGGMGTSSHAKLWAPAGALAVVAVLGLNALAFKAQLTTEGIEAAIAETYAQAMPNTPMVADPLLLIEREKRTLTSGMNTSNASGMTALLHEVGQAMEDAPFNSLVDFAWADNTLSLRFNANVTEAQQTSALQKLKARRLDAKWLIGAQSKLPVLQVKRSTQS